MICCQMKALLVLMLGVSLEYKDWPLQSELSLTAIFVADYTTLVNCQQENLDSCDNNYQPHAVSVSPRSRFVVILDQDLEEEDLMDVDKYMSQDTFQTALQEMPAAPTPAAMASTPPSTAPFAAFAVSCHGALTQEPAEQGTFPTRLEKIPAAAFTAIAPAPADFAAMVSHRRVLCKLHQVPPL